MSTSALNVLNTVFGYTEFRFKQAQIIESVLEGKDNLVIMPTGGGKSLCYQIPALVKEGLAIIVSPLIALMDDQVSALKQLGIEASALHSNISADQKKEIYDLIDNKTLKVLYVSPEKLNSENFIYYLRTINISLFAIDEAHCVSIWGNDFRPDYVRLRIIKDQFPQIPLIALTATADAATQKDIVKQLHLKDPSIFISSFERKNIKVDVRSGQERVKQIYKYIANREGQSGIIYCLSRKGTETIAQKLKDKGLKADYYHAKRSAEERANIQLAFQQDKIDIICATIAFGMGIDKPDIRYVIHYNMPKNLEGYYQEIGRAGRDGEESAALLFYSWADNVQLKSFITDSEASKEFKEVQSAKLDRMWQYASSQNCRTNFVLNYFGEYRSEPCQHCDNCLNPPKFIDGTTYAKMAISGIIRANERLNIQLLMDLLKGSGKKEVSIMGLDKLKTFGVGRSLPYPHWSAYINQLINQGIIQLDFSDSSRLKITPLSHQVLKDELKVELAEYQKQEYSKPKQKNVKVDITDYDESLYNLLKAWRLRKATEKKVPPYVIFHDRTLKNLSAIKPASVFQLLTVDGIGKAKADSYGNEILQLISKKG